ncbi:membrane-anchored lipid-binding protein Lam5p [Monosporozyma servazzii]
MSDRSDDDFTSWEPLFDTGDQDTKQGDTVAQTLDAEATLDKPFRPKSESPRIGSTEDSGEDNSERSSELNEDDMGMFKQKKNKDEDHENNSNDIHVVKRKLVVDTNAAVPNDDNDTNDVADTGSAGKKIASVESMGSKTPSKVQSPSFLNSMFSTFKSETTPFDDNTSGSNQDFTKSPTGSLKTNIVSSPNIISHRRESSISSRRKSSRARKASNDSLVNTINSPLQKAPQPAEIISQIHSNNPSTKDLNEEGEQQSIQETEEESMISETDSTRSSDEYNKKRFIEEKYSDTEYHYPTTERDADFHTLFESIAEDDRLIDDFSCALSREFLYQGRLYVSEKNLCFNSNILGWVAKFTIPMKDVRYIEKTSSAGLFPNAILIETDEERIQFNNFISREQTFKLIKGVWSKNLVFADLDAKHSSNKEKKEMEIHANRENYDDEYDEDSSNESVINEKMELNSTGHYKFKDDVKYTNEPPYTHDETSFPDETEPNEFVLKTLDLSCTPLQAYQIMFSDSNHDYTYDYLKANDSSDISEVTKYDENNQRTYEYEKSLNIPGGPKSTKCYAEEVIENYDPHGYIMIISTTKTPNVTSGKAFCTKTRYMYRWGSKNNCQLQVSYWLEWTGTSWFKKMIEAGAKRGQIEATEKMVDIINDYLDKNVVESDSMMTEIKQTDIQPIIKDVVNKVDLEKNIVNTNNQNVSSLSLYLIFLIILLIILLGVNIWYQMSTRRSILNIEKLLSAQRNLH